MAKGNSFDPVVLLLFIGIYFVLSYIDTKIIPELIYGSILLIYYFKYLLIKKKSI